jgi:hypothetical protein
MCAGGSGRAEGEGENPGKLKKTRSNRCVYSIFKNRKLHNVAFGQRLKKYGR